MKKKKLISTIVIGVFTVAVVGTGVLYATGKLGSTKAASTTTYQVAKMTTGDLQKSITGTGTLRALGSVMETAPVDVTVGEVLMEAGQSVKAGDALVTLDADAMNTTITSLKDEISTLETGIAQLAGKQSGTAYVKSKVAGRVKKITAEAGQDVAKLDPATGLLLLSTDDLMKVELTLSGVTVTLGQEVTVTSGDVSYDSVVAAISDDGTTCVVTLTDDGPVLDADAAVAQTDGTAIGSGKLQINQPFVVTAGSGLVDTVYISLNDDINTRTNLFYLTNVPVADSYAAMTASRLEKIALLDTAKALQTAGKITATQDGIVETVNAKEGQNMKAGESLCSLLTGGSAALRVSVDELDINSVAVGQTASIAVDALPDQTFEATVVSISQVGTNSNGVTTYPVELKLTSADSLRIGMNATATIVIEERKGVLLLPMEALQASRGEQYVWLYTGTLPTDGSEDPGTRTVVTTGLSNDNYVEITDGLYADDQVVIVRTATSSSGNNRFQQGGMNFPGMGDMGGQGQRPSGGSFPGGN